VRWRPTASARTPRWAPPVRRAALAALALAALPAAQAGAQDGCGSLGQPVCMLPFPSDELTVKADTPTGRRIHFSLLGMPRNAAGKPISPRDMNRADGFSPGQEITVNVPGLDLAQTGAVPIGDMARSFDPGQPIVVIDAKTAERHMIWAELDPNPANSADRNLIVRPGVNWTEGHRYVVALRNLRGADGALLHAPPVRAPRGGKGIYGVLRRAGIARDGLYLAWDFTVASRQSLTGRFLKIRDDAFAALGDTNLKDLKIAGSVPQYSVGPDLPDDLDSTQPPGLPDVGLPVGPGDAFDVAGPTAIDGVRNFSHCGADGCQDGESDTVARRVKGQLVVPCYLSTPDCAEGGHFVIGRNGLPIRIPGNTMLAAFECDIPWSALDAPGRPSLYGHGLFGSMGEVEAGNVQRMGQDHDVVYCATDWAGMSTTDLPNTAAILADLSRFPTLADRVQQGMLNFLMLGRAMAHPDGFAADPAFQIGGRSALEPGRAWYDGNSQGGIIGGALAAVMVDGDRAVLGVPAMNYSTLLRRSSDFDTYAQVLYRTYPNELERPLVLSLLQMLWDRAEADGYAAHMTERPLPNTPRHHVLMHAAFGDHQVANIAAEVEARTIGARVHQPALEPGRSNLADELYGLEPLPAGPFDGSAFVLWDSGPIRQVDGQTVGTDAAPAQETPPRAGQDPHELPRRAAAAQLQKSLFLRRGGLVVDTCDGGPCKSLPW
jgi:hypothetical protein